jgi:hypothetical protein
MERQQVACELGLALQALAEASQHAEAAYRDSGNDVSAALFEIRQGLSDLRADAERALSRLRGAPGSAPARVMAGPDSPVDDSESQRRLARDIDQVPALLPARIPYSS